MDSTKLVQDMGMATIMLAGLLLAVFSSANVINKEIEGRTALTVLSKPVSREAFVIGKYLGISAAITIAAYILSIILLLTFRFGVKDTASTVLDWGIMAAIFLSIVLAILIGLYQNYFLDKPFMTTAIWALAGTISCALLFFMIYNKDYTVSTFGEGLNGQLALASILTLQVIYILIAIAVASSTRTKAATSLSVCFVFFIGGLLSEYFLGRVQDQYIIAKILYKIMPNFQIFWVTEAMTLGQKIPLKYIAYSCSYTVLYTGAILFMAMLLFSGKEVKE
jgi:ABC-type transport system involved in multi-copper enzyme maturation permease subunit